MYLHDFIEAVEFRDLRPIGNSYFGEIRGDHNQDKRKEQSQSRMHGFSMPRNGDVHTFMVASERSF
jgi:hypothetical protein